ncbi:MAG TPA: histidine kinase [Cyanobacteria bacterium UBA8803]|nr:histidine kinase [Cyanobacteria bacterium UBA9273]HBL59979.1 histidine kinase [Cyanobacteria bacterium UBA8803]
MFSKINRAWQLLQTRIEYPPRQAALTRKIVDRIRNSLQLQVVLQTAVDEVAALLELDYCSFLWYFEEARQVEVVCERSKGNNQPSYLGYHPLEDFGKLGLAIAKGQLIINPGKVKSTAIGFRSIAQLFSERLRLGFCNSPESSHSVRGCSVWCGSKIAPPLTNWNGLTCQELGNCYQQNQPIWGYKASLLIPVTGKEGGIGFIACLSELPRHWSATEIEFLELIGESLEIAIRQAQLYEQTQKQAIREQLVNQIADRTRQSFDLDTILSEAIPHLWSALEVDRCLVHLVEDRNHLEQLDIPSEREMAECRATIFRRNHLYEVCRQPFRPSIDDFDPNGPITQSVMKHPQLIVIPDITQDERIGKDNQEYQKAQIKSSLVVPVQANGTLHAILYLNQCDRIRYWSKHDRELAGAVADHLAISLQQAYLYTRTQQQAAHSALQAQKLSEMLAQLRQTQAQLIQSEKMSSLGRMIAGVTHEINNPITFIYGNIPYLESYVKDLICLVEIYQSEYPTPSAEVEKIAEEVQLEFLVRDLPKILQSMKSGAERIHEIVQVLQRFARHNEASLKRIDINATLENTLLILHNQLVHTIQVERQYDNLPPIECYPQSINQTFLSILTNAIEALNRSPEPNKTLTLCTKWIPERGDEGRVQIAIADNGPGINLEIQSCIFDPFFTTKEVGEGRGLGLTIAYQTVVNQHKGHLEVKSQPGRGAEFVLELPVQHHHAYTSNPTSYQSLIATSEIAIPHR